MSKRTHNDADILEDDATRSRKLRKLVSLPGIDAEAPVQSKRNLQSLPDELLLRVLSFLNVEDLIKSQSVSRRVGRLAKDSQLWKQLYHERFVYRRFGRVVGNGFSRKTKDGASLSRSKINGKSHMDWKSKYRLSHKWSNGTCNRREITLASEVLPRTFLCLRGNMAITADVECGLRAWKTNNEQQTLVACKPLHKKDSLQDSSPSALSVEVDQADSTLLNIVVGFEKGNVELYRFHLLHEDFRPRQSFSCFASRAVSALAQSDGGYFLAMSDNQAMSLFQTIWAEERPTLPTPQLISSLLSQSNWKPVSVNLRTSAKVLMASIIYAYPRFLSGWSVGLQELRWDLTTHALLSTRLANSPQPGSSTRHADNRGTLFLPPTSTKPTSLCYTHPYLLATHPDNTLSLYMVRSTDTELSIGPGMRLWGHTSDVYAANIGDRGKAVTIAYGGDVRVWQFEEGLTSALARKATPGPLVSVKLQPTSDVRLGDDGDHLHGATRLDPESEPKPEELHQPSRSDQSLFASVDFDEERLVVLQNRGANSQALLVYDFT